MNDKAELSVTGPVTAVSFFFFLLSLHLCAREQGGTSNQFLFPESCFLLHLIFTIITATSLKGTFDPQLSKH